jgi:polyhydroxyalkanoate synthesis regulator phasin
MAGTNQIASETWVPQTDKFGNQVNPVWAQNGGTGTPEQIAAYTTQIRDLANRALSTSGAGADAFNFAGYTLPNNKYVQQALQGWTPPETKVLDPISGRLTSTTQLSYADALAKLGVTPGTTSTYTADKTFAPNDAMASFSQDQKNNLAGSFSDIGNQKNNASYISSPLVNKTIPVTSDANTGNRQDISDVQKPGYIKAYDTNNGYKQVYVPAGKYVPGISMYPKPTNTITPDKMRNETAINLPGTATNGGSPVGAGEASAMIAGGKTAVSDLIQQLTPAQTDAEKKQQALLDQMASLAGQEANKAADQLTAEQSANLPQLRQQFAEINGQIMTKSAEHDALVKAQEGKPITMSSIIGSERAILNAKASDIGMLTARAQALQGQIETAQSTVNRSIDLKYSSIDARLNMYQAQLNALQPTLTKEEKIKWKELRYDNSILYNI